MKTLIVEFFLIFKESSTQYLISCFDHDASSSFSIIFLKSTLQVVIITVKELTESQIKYCNLDF